MRSTGTKEVTLMWQFGIQVSLRERCLRFQVCCGNESSLCTHLRLAGIYLLHGYKICMNNNFICGMTALSHLPLIRKKRISDTSKPLALTLLHLKALDVKYVWNISVVIVLNRRSVLETKVISTGTQADGRLRCSVCTQEYRVRGGHPEYAG